jgi:CHAT domain-containing protein
MSLLSRLRLALLALAAVSGLATAAAAREAPRDDFPLGRSGISGAVCQAVRDWDDKLAAGAGRRAWQVRCRGWSQTLGHIYAAERGRDATAAAWRAELAARAACDAASRSTLANAADASALRCKSIPAGASYVAYSTGRGRSFAAADGFSGVADVLAAGLEVAAGRRRPPAAISDPGAPGVQGEIDSLNAAAQTNAESVEAQRVSAYRDAEQWRFGEAEARFSSLADLPSGISPGARAEAYLNVAMNASNGGRFAEADAYFAASVPWLKRAHAGELDALALNDRAAHARNQRKFEAAIALARQANDLRAQETESTGLDIERTATGDVKLGPDAADAFNAEGKGLHAELGPHEQALIRKAQALQIIGTSQEALHRDDAARASLDAAAAILAQAWGGHPLGAYAPWLAARVQADIARLDRNRGDLIPAVRRLQAAVDAYSARYPGSLVTGHFMIELARAKAAAGEENEALADYEAAFQIFRDKRGALGPSADYAGAYFDILLHRIGDRPAADPADVQRFFDSSEALVSESTAEAALEFAERLASSNSATAGLARARDATLRQIDDKLAAVRQAQAAGAGASDQRAKALAEIDSLRAQANELEQKIFAADPRYRSALKTAASLGDLQAALGFDEAYVKVLLLANRGYGLIITRGEARPYGVELTRAEARDLAARLRKPFDEVATTGRLGRYDVALARQLYVKLFGPVETELKPIKRIIYQPDPSLVGVPVGALVTDDASLQAMRDNLLAAVRDKTALSYRGVAWLAAQKETSLSISTAAFVNGRKVRASAAPKPFLGFGDPVLDPNSPSAFASVAAPAAWVKASGVDFCADMRHALLQLPPLPETAVEVKTVARALGAPESVMLGRDFTEENVRRLGAGDGLAQYRVLYFATHGLLPQANGCLQPSLVTSAVGGGGLLDTQVIPDLRLDADLVVLSACDTGATGDGGGGAALGGLVATFTYAGARNLMVSNWEVDSAATEQLMTRIFSAAGMTQGAAMKAAETAFIEQGGVYSHPFYWAAFSLVGDAARALPAPAPDAAHSPASGDGASSAQVTSRS